jgi:predicted Zn-dependent protease
MIIVNDLKNINKIIKKLISNSTLNTLNINNHEECAYCGTENIISNSIWICTNCKCINSSLSKKLIMSDPALLKTISEIYELRKSEMYDDAIAKYDAIKNYTDVRFAYAEARLCRYASDKILEQVDYNRKDFMEENAELKSKASAYESKAKHLFYKVIYAVQNAQNPTQEMLFMRAMAELELKRFKDVKATLTLFDSSAPNPMADYTKVLFDIEIKDYENALDNASKIISSNIFKENAFYYAAIILIKLNKINEAKKILKALSKFNLKIQ